MRSEPNPASAAARWAPWIVLGGSLGVVAYGLLRHVPSVPHITPPPGAAGPLPTQNIFLEEWYSYFVLNPACQWEFVQQNWFDQDVAELLAATRLRPIGVWKWLKEDQTWHWYVVDTWRGSACFGR